MVCVCVLCVFYLSVSMCALSMLCVNLFVHIYVCVLCLGVCV